jgi:ankyrin repeat protein
MGLHASSYQWAVAIKGLAAGALSLLLIVSAGARAASPVADAASEADAGHVRALIAAGADVNLPQADGSTALLWAAYQSDPQLVAELIAAGADPNAANKFGVTPLLQASRTGDVPVIDALLAGGADPDIAIRDGETPLMAAARAGSVPSVAVLLEHGADPDAAEAFQGQTALMWATAEGHLEVVDALLNAGADPNIQARASELTKRSTRTDFPSGGFTALMWAARDGNEAVIRRLVEGGADINLKNADNASAMMIAIVNDRFDLAAKMLELGADPDDGSLYQAVEMRDATTDWLAKDGTQWRADYPNELTALGLQRILLEAGADPDKPFVGRLHSTSMCCDSYINATPFYRAAVAADVAGLELMLQYDPDLEWAPERAEEAGPMGNGNAGKTPLMAALNGGKGVGMAGGPGDIREGADPPFREVANREPADAVRLLLAAGANPDAMTPGEKGEAALHVAAKDGKLDIVRILAEAGATLDLPNAEGKTALEVVEAMPPREPPPAGSPEAGRPLGAQPAEVAELLRELMQIDIAAVAPDVDVEASL